jgi:hypothetical protein
VCLYTKERRHFRTYQRDNDPLPFPIARKIQYWWMLHTSLHSGVFLTLGVGLYKLDFLI